MRDIKYNNISKDEFLKIDENNLVLATNPGRMGDEDGSYFVIKDNDNYVAYRVSGWMYGTKEENPVTYNDMSSHFSKWKEAWNNFNNEEYDGKYKYIYMGFGNGLSVDREIYDEFFKYLEYVSSKDPKYSEEGYRPSIYYNSWENALLLYMEDKKIEFK